MTSKRYDTYNKDVRILTTDGKGSTYGVTLPDKVNRHGDYIKLTLSNKQIGGDNIPFILGESSSENEGWRYRKIQGGSRNHPSTKISLPKRWTKNKKGGPEFPINKDTPILVEYSNRQDSGCLIKIFRRNEIVEEGTEVKMELTPRQNEALEELIKEGHFNTKDQAIRAAVRTMATDRNRKDRIFPEK